MTLLSMYAETDGKRPLLTTTDVPQIGSRLGSLEVGFERWTVDSMLVEDMPSEALRSLYGQWLDDLKSVWGYSQADVISLWPEHPEWEALRAKFLREHVHAEGKVRFFVTGCGAFYLHIGAEAAVVVCQRGDLLRIPANTRHWFDTGPRPHLKAIRVFSDPKCWVAHYTGEDIAERFPPLEAGCRPADRGEPQEQRQNLEGNPMIDHVYISVTNLEKALAFYLAALKPLGWSAFANYDSASGPHGVPDLFGIGDDVYGSSKAVGSSIWLCQRKPGETGLYLGIVCDTDELVDVAYAAAINAGGTDEGKPTDRAYFAPATTPPTLPTSTATVSSSYTSRGTLSGTPGNRRRGE